MMRRLPVSPSASTAPLSLDAVFAGFNVAFGVLIFDSHTPETGVGSRNPDLLCYTDHFLRLLLLSFSAPETGYKLERQWYGNG